MSTASSSSPLRRSPRRRSSDMNEAGPSTSSPATRAQKSQDDDDRDVRTPTRRATKAQQRALLFSSPQHSAHKRTRRANEARPSHRGSTLASESTLQGEGKHASSTSNTTGPSMTREERRAREAQEREALQEELEVLEADIGSLTTEYKQVQRRRRRQQERERGMAESAASGSEDGLDESRAPQVSDLFLVSEKNVGDDTINDVEEMESAGLHSASEVKELEAMLRDMDDKELVSLLTNGSALSSDLLGLLPTIDALPAVVPPARSAGIEGTGSGARLDQEEERLARACTEKEIGDEAALALRARLDRSDELMESLSRFCAIELTSIQSASPIRAKDDVHRLLRRTSMRVALPGNLGQMTIDMEVEEDESKRMSPQIVGLNVEVGDPVFAAIGEHQIGQFVDKVNLPALFLAVRTMIPLARLRFHLFAHLASKFAQLANGHVEKLAARGIDLFGGKKAHAKKGSSDVSLPSLATLIDPEAMGTLTLRNAVGAQLDVRFAVEFNQWGHARPHITLAPLLPSHVRLSRRAREVKEALPARFAHLCAHCPAPFDTATALAATIQAYFDL